MTFPVMYVESAENSQATVSATSDVVPTRPIGSSGVHGSSPPHASRERANISVSIGPGAMPLTRMPSAAVSIAADRVSDRAAALDAAYGAMPSNTVRTECTDRLLTIDPPPAAV